MRTRAQTTLGLAVIVLSSGVAASPAPSAAPGVTPPSAAPSNAPSPVSSRAPSAAPKNAPGKSTLETPNYKIETDDISYHANGDYTMPHKVMFSRPGSDATADRAEGNYKRGTVSLIGNVVIHDNGNAPETNSDDEYAKGGPATLTCDHLDVDSKAKVYTAIGHVHFEQGNRKAVADHGVLNRSTGMLHLEGHVLTSEGESSLKADSVDYNLNSKKTQAVGRPIIIKQPVPTPEPGSITPSPKPKKRRLPIPL